MLTGWIVWFAGGAGMVLEPLHAALELVGGCMAIGVGLFLWLRLRDGTVERHFLWAIGALVAMGILDGVHGALPFGLAWSWTRHVATLFGGLLFGCVWVPVDAFLWQRRRMFISGIVVLSAVFAVLLCQFASFLPAPWSATGYTFWPKFLNVAGGVGFMTGAVFFLREYARKAERDDKVFAGQTLMFGVSGLLFLFSHVWGPEWWLWHVFRFAAYAVAVRAGYQTASRLNREMLRQKGSLEGEVEERTRALRLSEERYRTLFSSIDEGFCVIRVIFDASNRAIDYQFLEVNPAFVKQTGLENAQGKTMRELVPKHEEHWFETYGQVALRGESARFQSYAGQLGRWYEVYAFRLGKSEDRQVAIIFDDITARKRAHEAMQSSEARLSGALRIARLGTFEWNVITSAINLDARSEEIFGFKAGEATRAEQVFGRVERSEFDRVFQEAQTSLRTLSRLETEYRIRLPDGSARTVISINDVAAGPDGKAERVFGVFGDITERRQRELKLAEQARLLDLSYDAIMVRDAHDRISYWNRGAEEVYGYTKAEALGKQVHELLQTRFPEPLDLIQAKLATEKRWSGELIHVRRDGGRIVVHSRWALDRDKQGRPASVLETSNDISERKRLEEAVRSSEARFRGLMEQAPFSVQVLSPEGKTLRVNRAWEELWGAKLEHLASYNMLQDQQLETTGILPLLKKAFAGEPVRLPEIKYDPNKTLPEATHHEDSVRWVGAVAYPLKDHDGRILEVVLVHEDVTERRRAEAGLRESHSLLRTAMDAGKLGAWDWHVQRNQVTWTERLYEFHGLPPGTFEGTVEAFGRLVHPEDWKAVQAALELAMSRKAPYEVEFRTIRPDGEVRWLFTRAEVFMDAEGAPQRMIGITQDVTDRKKFEEALLEREEQLRGTFENAAVGMALVDLHGHLLRINDALCRITGYSRKELILKTVADITHPEDLVPDWNQANRLLAGELNTYSIEKRYVRKEGSIVWVNLTVSLQRSGQGKPQNFISVVEDITERKQAQEALQAAQEELRRQNESLEEVVSERTAKLREALAELEGYSYSIAHDMRAPLRGMQGFAKLLVEDYAHELSPEARQYLGRITNSAERLDRLIQDVLNYSRIVSGELQLERVEPASLLEDIIESYPHLQKAKRNITIEKPLLAVMANRAALTQVFSNLLGNAIKFVAQEVEPRVVVRSESLGSKVRFWVEDNGIGIEPNARKRIFQLFQRLHRPELYEGTGLGLAIVRKSAERMGGAVGVESEAGVGSRFWIELPGA